MFVSVKFDRSETFADRCSSSLPRWGSRTHRRPTRSPAHFEAGTLYMRFPFFGDQKIFVANKRHPPRSLSPPHFPMLHPAASGTLHLHGRVLESSLDPLKSR